MFNMPGGPELMVIVLIALVVLGPQQLPKAMRTMGNVMAEIRKVSSGFQAEMRSAMDTITDDGSSKDKPKSATMGDAKLSSAVPASSPNGDGPATEVVARNDGNGANGAIAATATERDAGGPAAETGVVKPPVDPADRAAG